MRWQEPSNLVGTGTKEVFMSGCQWQPAITSALVEAESAANSIIS